MLSSNSELVKEIHPTKNILDISKLKCKSNKKLWWLCSKGHEWEAIIANRNKGNGCPFCSNCKVCSDNCMAKYFPEIAKEWHPDKNILKASDVLPGNNKKFWWKCSINPGHEWETSPNVRCIKGCGCPHCRGNTTFGGNTIADKYPQIAKEWHPTKNGELKPSDVCPSAMTKIWWICPKKHEYQAIPGNRTVSNTGCPYCTGKLVNSDNNLAEAFPKVSAEWHPTKNAKKPTDYTLSSGKKVWWQCSKNTIHEWESTIVNRTDKGHGCPVCSGRKADSTSNFELFYPEMAKEWHPTKNGDLKPNKISRGYSSKVWWLCSKNTNHEWETKVCNRTANNTGCPFCKMSHMEKAVELYCEKKQIKFQAQKKYSELGGLSYDFYLPDKNILIECDGRQHFENAPDYFHHDKGLKWQRIRDIRKNVHALKACIPLIRIAFSDEKYINSLLTAFIARVERGFNGIVYSNHKLYRTLV
jgi:very-short-patch-repair endonuclease